MADLSVPARPDGFSFVPGRTALLVVDMQNDFGADGGMFDRAGIPIGGIKAVVAPIVHMGTWNTEILPELTPGPDDVVVAKHRYSGFFETELDAVLRERGIDTLLVTGCTTSVCVESTIRDAFYRDYRCLLLADCAAEPLGSQEPRANHDASLLTIEALFGWVGDSTSVITALQTG